MSGLVARAAIVCPRPPLTLRAFGSSTESSWTTEAYAVVATVLSYLEPDPDVTWDEKQVESAIARSFDLENEARRLRTH